MITKQKQIRTKINVPEPTEKTKQLFKGWERIKLIRFIDGTCTCSYCELARQELRNREKQYRFF